MAAIKHLKVHYFNRSDRKVVRHFSSGLNYEHSISGTDKSPVDRVDPEWVNAKSYSEIPGATKLGFIRAGLPGGFLYKVPISDIHTIFNNKFGPITKIPSMLRRPEMVFSYLPEDFEKILRTEGIWPIRNGLDTFTFFRENVRPDIYKGSGGLVNNQGKSWADLRTKANPILMKPKIIKHHLPEVDEIAQEFLQRIDNILDPQTKETPGNFATEVNRWILESTAIFAINARLGLINNSRTEDGEKLMNSVNTFFQLTHDLEVLPSIWKYYKTRKFYQLMDTLSLMSDINLKFVNAALERYEEKKLKDPNYKPLGILETLVQVDRDSAIIMAMDMLVAGADTTSSLFLGVLYRLAKSPNVQEKLRREVVEILPSKDSILTEDKMVNLPYLRACIKESLRINPVVPGNLRSSGQDIVLSGYQIPKGTLIFMANMVLTTDEKYYPKPNEFLPERWLRDNSSREECPSARDVNPFIYLPFGFGPRACIGRRIVEMTIEVMICRIIRNYRVSWDHPDMQYQNKLIFTPIGDLKFKLEKL